MENNEKLLEAARMIKRHCKETGINNPCCFALDGICKGIENCTIGDYDLFPCDWDVKDCWTPADKALAAGLKANGYNSVTRMHGSETVLVMGRSQAALELGKGVFANLQLGEVVNLDDIIGEG